MVSAIMVNIYNILQTLPFGHNQNADFGFRLDQRYAPNKEFCLHVPLKRKKKTNNPNLMSKMIDN